MVQTYNTSLLYLILSKATFQPIYLRVELPTSHPDGPLNRRWKLYKTLGQIVLASTIWWSWTKVCENGHGTYTGLILLWACPFLLLLW